MKKLLFMYNRENLNFVIKEKEIFYSDRKFNNWVRCMPPPENFMKVVALSRNRIPSFLIEMFKFNEAEIKEYNEAKDEEALAQIIIKDAKFRGCIYIKPEKEKPEKEEKSEGEQNATERP